VAATGRGRCGARADLEGVSVSDKIGKLTITINKTSVGQLDYVQIASPSAMPVNIVLVAQNIVVDDRRPQEPDA